MKGVPVDRGHMERVIGVGSEELRKIKMVIGVAGEENEREAIFGALRGGYLNAIITDEQTAMAVLSLESSAKKKT